MAVVAASLGNVLLLLAGDPPGKELFQQLCLHADFIIAADSAAGYAVRNGIVPNVVIGDLDSVDQETLDLVKNAGTDVIRIQDQDSNDLEKALLWIIERPFTTLSIAGATGGRLDHTLTNLSVIARYADRIPQTTMYDDLMDHHVQSGPCEIKLSLRIGNLVSLTPLGNVTGVTTEGLKYPLSHEDLSFGQKEGLSNVVSGEMPGVAFSSGSLLISKKRVQ